jgi:sec-independent protein translocase protein TatA
MPLGLHLPDLLIILAIALLIFGPKKLPDIGATIGKSITSFKKGMKEIENDNEDKEKEKTQEKALLEQKQSELEALEREIASKKAAALDTHEATDPIEVRDPIP